MVVDPCITLTVTPLNGNEVDVLVTSPVIDPGMGVSDRFNVVVVFDCTVAD